MISKKVPPAWSLPKKDLKTTIFPIFLFAQKQIWSMGAVQNIGNCTKYWELDKILGTVQNIGNCTKFWEMYKLLWTAQNIGNWTIFWEMYKILGTEQSFGTIRNKRKL